MVDHLTELREQVGLALCAKRYHDIRSIYQDYLKNYGDIPPADRQMLYAAYNALILDDKFKSYWKLTSTVLNHTTDLDYLEIIESEIDRLCKDIVELIDHHFLASRLNQDLDIIITLRQRADFLFFNSSIARPATKQILLQSALRSYTEGRLALDTLFDVTEDMRVTGLERSRLTLPMDEPERVLIQIRKCACEVQLSNGLCSASTYLELVDAIHERKSAALSSDDPLLAQLESYRLELEVIRCE